jgi:hypothetical protein
MSDHPCTHKRRDGSSAFECTHTRSVNGVMTVFMVCRLCGKPKKTRKVIIPEKYLDRMHQNKLL